MGNIILCRLSNCIGNVSLSSGKYRSTQSSGTACKTAEDCTGSQPAGNANPRRIHTSAFTIAG